MLTAGTISMREETFQAIVIPEAVEKLQPLTRSLYPYDNLAEFQKKAQEVWNDQAGKMYSKEDLDKVIKYRDEYRAKNPGK